MRNLGNAKLPETPPGDSIQYVLDGQQRITSVFASLQGLKIERDGGTIDDFGQIFIDLNASDDSEIVIIDASGKDPKTVVRVVDIATRIIARPGEEHQQRVELNDVEEVGV